MARDRCTAKGWTYSLLGCVDGVKFRPRGLEHLAGLVLTRCRRAPQGVQRACRARGEALPVLIEPATRDDRGVRRDAARPYQCPAFPPRRRSIEAMGKGGSGNFDLNIMDLARTMGLKTVDLSAPDPVKTTARSGGKLRVHTRLQTTSSSKVQVLFSFDTFE